MQVQVYSLKYVRAQLCWLILGQNGVVSDVSCGEIMTQNHDFA